MIEDLYYFAVSNQSLRKLRLISLLQKYHISFSYDLCTPEQSTYFLISSSKNPPKLVFGAHFDSVIGSTGANDNAAAVIILIHLFNQLRSIQTLPFHIVFFDGEENGHIGAISYIKCFQNVLHDSCYINLDMCGIGDTIVVAVKNLRTHFLSDILSLVVNNNMIKIHIQENLPNGDDIIFESKSIPNISVCATPHNDIFLLNNYLNSPPWRRKKIPYILQTLHNMPLDFVHSIQSSTMELVYQFIYEIIKNSSIF